MIVDVIKVLFSLGAIVFLVWDLYHLLRSERSVGRSHE